MHSTRTFVITVSNDRVSCRPHLEDRESSHHCHCNRYTCARLPDSGAGRMITSKPSLRSGFDSIIRPASSGAGRTTPSQPGHYPLILWENQAHGKQPRGTAQHIKKIPRKPITNQLKIAVENQLTINCRQSAGIWWCNWKFGVSLKFFENWQQLMCLYLGLYNISSRIHMHSFHILNISKKK